MLRRKRSVSFGGFGWIDKSTVSALRARKQELLTISNVPVTDCPPSPPRTAPPTMKSAHFFDMMDKMEDDYIPYPRIEEVLERRDTRERINPSYSLYKCLFKKFFFYILTPG